jgi:hypothetical protein
MRNDREEVAQTIERFINGAGDPWEWDDFISVGWSDLLIEEVRKECAELSKTFPGTKETEYCSEEGMRILAKLAERLRRP